MLEALEEFLQGSVFCFVFSCKCGCVGRKAQVYEQGTHREFGCSLLALTAIGEEGSQQLLSRVYMDG